MAVVVLDALRVLGRCWFICFYFIARDGHAPSTLLYWMMADVTTK
jgi:hypothetical protein